MSTATTTSCEPSPMLAQLSTAMTTDLVSVSVTATVVALLLVAFQLRTRAARQTA